MIASALVCAPLARAELNPDQIALVVNKNVPDSAKLADYYAKARLLPDGRIIELDLPAGDEMPFDVYERTVLPQLRRFLIDHQLREQVKCLVSFYGVPLRISARSNTPDETRELAMLKKLAGEAQSELQRLVTELERKAAEIDPDFKPLDVRVAGVDGVVRRIEYVNRALVISLQRLDDPQQRQARIAEVTAMMRQFRQPPAPEPDLATPSTSSAATSQSAASSQAAVASQPATMSGSSDVLDVDSLTVDELSYHRFDPAARKRLRALAGHDGLISWARVLSTQIDYLTPEATDAAFDSELSLTWWPAYARSNWLPNALHYNYLESRTPKVLMVMRLDGTTPQQVRDIIAASIGVEREGLSGRVVVDGGGSAKLDPQHKQPTFAAFDKHFSDLALLLRQKTQLQTTYDSRPDVLPANSFRDVAVYAGWYSVGQYVPACALKRGAVAFHVASYELTSLRDPNNNGWCKGLLRDGAAATFGPVSEPYLHSFPSPDDFVPLLLTGKMTLAEAYWHTTPLVSWKMAAIGDPLYRPFRKNPAIRVEDLPTRLGVVFQQIPATQPNGK